MNRTAKRIWTALVMALVVSLCATWAQASTIGDLFDWLVGSDETSYDSMDGENPYPDCDIEEDGSYDTKEEVCAYLVRYHCLPSNYMTKKEARKAGWEGGALHLVVDGMCIGGDYYGNYEGLLPEVRGREYHECDIDTLGGKSRGAKRIIYSGDDDNGDWNIYYTEDHYESFTLLWGDD